MTKVTASLEFSGQVMDRENLKKSNKRKMYHQSLKFYLRSVVINSNETCQDGPGLFSNHNEVLCYRQRVGERFD